MSALSARTQRWTDLATVGLGSVRLAGATTTSMLDHVVLAGTAADVTHTVVGGEVVVRDGRHTRLADVPAALRAAISALYTR